MPFLTKIISGGPELLIAFALCLTVIKASLINLPKPCPSTCYLFFRRCIFLLLQYSANIVRKRQFLNSPAGTSLPSAFYSSGDLPVVKSNRSDVFAFLSGSVQKSGFLLGIFVLLSFGSVDAATITSTRTGGNWNDPSTWVGGVVPSNGDDVTIASGSTVVINSDAVVGTLTVTGVLQYDSSSAYTLTASEFITVNAEGVFRSASSGTIKNQRLIARGSVINNGIIDFSSNANETGVELVFTGPGNAIFNCSDAVLTNLRSENGIILDKGTSAASVLSFIPGKAVQVLSDGSSSAKGFLTIENGTFNIIGSKSFRNPVFSADGTYTIPASGGFWLGNQNAEITGMNGQLIIHGELKVTNGIFNAGTSVGSVLKTEGNGNLKISGGVVNVAGKLRVDGGVCSISGGRLNLAMMPNSADTEPALNVSAKAKLEVFGTPLITITYPNSGQQLANDILIQEGSGSKFISGGAIQLGTEATPVQSIFLVSGERIIPYLTAFSECSTVAYNTSKADIATTQVTALPRIALDKTAPEITVPEKITIKCGETVSPAYASLTEFTSAGGVVSDNCAVNPIGFKLVKEVRSKVNCPYVITRTYEVSDASGNTATAEHQIQVEGIMSEPQAEPVSGQPIAQELKLKSAMAICTASSGNWNNTSTWSCGAIPTSLDDVIIPAGVTVSVDAAAFCNDITIAGTLNYSGTNTLTVNGNWTNNGTYSAGTNGIVVFAGTATATIGGSSSTVFKQFIINKGAQTNILQVTRNIQLDGDIIFTSGTMLVNSGVTVNCTHNSGFIIEQLAGMKILGTFNSGAFSIDNKGLFEVAGGTANLGTIAGNSLTIRSTGDFLLSSGQVNVAGRFDLSGGDATISGGTMNINTVGNNSASPSFHLSLTSNFTMTGGNIIFPNPNGTGNLDLQIENSSGSKTFSSGNITFGTGAVATYRIESNIPFPSNLVAANNANLILKMLVSTSGTYNFPLFTSGGTAIPATVTFLGTPSAGASIQMETTGSKYSPNNKSSVNYLNRFWTVVANGINNPINVTATYRAIGDYAGTESKIAAGSFVSAWTKFGVVNTLAHSLSVNGITDSNFIVTGITSDPPTVSASASPSTICLGASSSLTATPVGDTPFTYSWAPTTGLSNPNIANPVATPGSTTTYTVTVTDGNGFTASGTATIIVNPANTISLSSASGTDSQSKCINSSITNIAYVTSGATGATFSNLPAGVNGSWATNVVTISGTPTVSGTYTYTITLTGGCGNVTQTGTITVNPLPVPTVTGVTSACAGSTGNIYFTEPGMGTYTWTVSAGGNITSGAGTNSITVSWSTAGAQLVTVSYTNANGCTAASPTIYNVTVSPKPTVVITNPLAVCSPSTVDLTASAVTSGSTAGLTYSYWTDAAGTIALNNPSTVSVTGTYYIKGTTAAGCSDIKAVTVTINPKPTVVITNPAAVCSPATVNLSAASVTVGSTAGLTYSYWFDAAATNSLANYSTVSVTGTYYIKGATSSCYDIKPVSVIVNQTPVGTNTSTTICSVGNPNVNLAATVSVPSSFTWVVGSVTGSVSNTTSGSGSTLSQTLTGSGNGGTVVYRVTPTSTASGCVGSVYSVTVTVNTLPTVTTTETEVIACERSFVSFTAAATGSPNPTVQWQIASGTGGPWTNLVDAGTNIVGATTNSLLIFIPNGAPSPRYYRALYTNTCGSTPSNAIKLISDKGPLLNTDMPGTINGCAGGTITFTAKVTGAGAGNKPENRIDGVIQYLDGSTWVDIPSSAVSDNSGMLDYSFSIAISNYPYGTTFRIAFTGKCGSVSSSTRVIYPTSVVTTQNGCVGSAITLSHDGSPGGTWNIINSSGSIVYTLSNAPGQTLNYTPTAVGCYTAQYSTGACNDAKQFVVFPALPNVAFVTSGCGSAVSLSAIPTYAGFNAEYAVQPPSGVMSSWGTFAQAQGLLSNTAGCWTLKARYVLAADCGTTLAGSTTTATGCSEAVFNAFVFPSKPVLTAPFNTCASAFTLPSVPVISGFTVQWSIDNGAFTSTPTIPTTPGCHSLKARYVVSVACGTVAAGSSGGIACESDPVSVVIFPLAPPAPTLSAGCGAFTVTPPSSVAGFNIEYSFDNGSTWLVSNTSPVGENCTGYIVKTRYVLAAICGTTAAGTVSPIPACGESPSVIRKVDTTPPAITCNTPAPAPVCVNTGITYVHSGTSWDASVTDNCSVQSISAALSGTTTATNLTTLNNVAFNIGTTIVTWTASDGCNTSTCSFAVTVNPKPVINSITAPDLCSGGTFTVTPVNGTNGIVPVGTTYSWSVPTVTGGLTGGAAGSGASITGTLNNPTSSVQTATYTVTPTSGAGCAGTPFSVTVSVNPILTCSISGPVGPLCPNSTGNIFSAVGGMSNYSWIINGNGTISAGGNTQTVSVTAGTVCNAPFLLTLNYNDLNGCSSSCSVTVNVIDNTPPSISCPAAVNTVTNSGQCIAAPVALGTPTINDNCTGSITVTNNAPAQFGIGTTTVIWTATDACGNVATCAQTVTVIDNQPGTLTCTASFQWPADDNELFATGVPIPKPPLTGPSYTYTDNCGTYTLTWTLTGATSSNSASTGVNEIPTSYPRLNVGDNTFTYTVTDAGGNISVCSFIVNVYSAPEIACAAGIVTDTSTNSCTSTFDPGGPDLIQGQPNITWTWEIDSPISATVSGTTITTVPLQSPPSIGLINFDHGTTTITWTATNAAGTASCTQIITVNDIIQPIYTPSPLPIVQCVENIISATYALGDPKVVVTTPDPDYYLFRTGTDTNTLDLDLINYLKDNCCPDVGTMTWTITFSAVPNNPNTPGSISGSGQPSTYFTDIKLWGDGVTYQPVNHIISYTVYDCHGNHSTFDRQITINPRPELTKMP